MDSVNTMEASPSPRLSLVCPVFNEQENIRPFLARVSSTLEKLSYTYEIIFINDGSTDSTLNTLLESKKGYPQISIINLSRNFGKEAALTAGLDHASGEAIIPIDVDLQDPPEVIPQLLAKWQEGYDVVLAQRTDRSSDTHIKRKSAEWFYRLHSTISKTKIPENCGDFRLITREVLLAVKKLPENQRFMKGIFAWVGFKTTTITYTREPRAKGDSKFNMWQLWNFALEGITSFSTAPLRIWLYIGVLVALFAFFYGSFILVKTVFFGVDVPGYASTLTSILFLGGIQLISIGTLGEYIGRVYMEIKGRPVYIIESIN